MRAKVTFLSPVEANFTNLARIKFAHILNIPYLASAEGADLELVDTNEEVFQTTISHRGYGVVAMATSSKGRYDGPVGSVVNLLNYYESSDACPTRIMAALPMEVDFNVVGKRTLKIGEATMVLGHEKSYGACQRNIEKHGWQFIPTKSNGLAAQLVATKPEFVKAVALCPNTALREFKQLKSFFVRFADQRAVTTFYLLAPRKMHRNIGPREVNQSLLVCRLKNRPDALSAVTHCFGSRGINLLHNRDYYVGDGESAHVFNYDCPRDQISKHALAMEEAVSLNVMDQHLLMGPFPMLEDIDIRL